MQEIHLKLDQKFTRNFNIEGYGFFIKNLPSNFEAYIIPDNDTARLRSLQSSRVIKYEEKFRRFRLTTLTALSGKTLLLIVAETLEDFQQFPTNDNGEISGSISETNVILHSIDNKIYKADTDNVIISGNSAGLASESTLSSIDNHITKADTDNVIISGNSAGLASESTLSSIDNHITKADTDNVILSGNNAGIATESTLSSINSKITTCNTEQIKTFFDYQVLQGKSFFTMDTFNGNYEILISNPTGSGKKLYLASYYFTAKQDTNIEIYSDSTGSGSNLLISNRQIGNTTSPNFTIQTGNFTTGTLLGDMQIFANNKYRASLNDTGLFEILEGHSLHFKFSQSTAGDATYDLIIIEI